ncbi:hypothetical protein KKF84_04470 [Myxococcota bacterium]|nr:hypothetical protein [Myxococcota bacterium]
MNVKALPIILWLLVPVFCWGCSSAPLPRPRQEICTNGIDDDWDGHIDCADQDCFGTAGCPGEICDNGIDDDGDGLIDCDDPSCREFAGCYTEICDNGVDDDGDGAVDCADFDCLAARVCLHEQCANQIDDNDDGLIDCDDPQCEVDPHCNPEVCDNGVDDDGDGQVDCDDYDCRMDPGCSGEVCDNGVDDDADGLVDCCDPHCFSPTGGWCGECDPFSHLGCSTGQACYVSKTDEFVGECYSFPGTALQGELCVWPDDCEPGLFCTDEGPTLSRCAVLCYPQVDETCPMGTACGALVDDGINSAWGFCR